MNQKQLKNTDSNISTHTSDNFRLSVKNTLENPKKPTYAKRKPKIKTVTTKIPERYHRMIKDLSIDLGKDVQKVHAEVLRAGIQKVIDAKKKLYGEE